MELNRFEIKANPTQQDIEFLEDRIYEYNVERTGLTDGQLLVIYDRDERGEIRAGLCGWTWGGRCQIDDLWVRADSRGQGIGTALLQTAEQVAASRDCVEIGLDSYSFQAPDFYRQYGYKVWAVLEDWPRGHKRYYLKKRLR